MSARIPKRLAGPAQLSGAAATLYTAPNPSSLPTGMLAKAIVKHIHFQNPTAAAIAVTLSITADAASKRFLDAVDVPAHGTRDDYPYLVLEAGETIQGFAGTASQVVYEIGGDEIITGG
jgi:hypothetical protein